MSDMDGNPYVDPLADAVIFSAEDAPLQNVEFLLDNLVRATKAVAYEQRTANLIALATMNPQWYGSTSQESFDMIDARLGLNKKED